MIPELGTTCRFVFTAKFSTLNGVYRVRAETTFKDALISGIDFVEGLYTPAGLSRDDFTADYSSYLNDRIVVLESVLSSDTVYYVPESVFLNVPDPTIREYFPLILAVDLGVTKNTQSVLPLIDAITDLVRSQLGTDNPVRLVTSSENKVYLTDDEYAVVETERAKNITRLIPLSVQLKQSQDKIVQLAAQIAAYEKLIAQTSTVVNP